jgi:hypothetical protein
MQAWQSAYLAVRHRSGLLHTNQPSKRMEAGRAAHHHPAPAPCCPAALHADPCRSFSVHPSWPNIFSCPQSGCECPSRSHPLW